MKLLLDENLSRYIVDDLRSSEMDIDHVSAFELESATDRQIWDVAKDNGYAIVSKDADFHHLSFTFGARPKTIWLKLGNCSTRQITACIARLVSRRCRERAHGDYARVRRDESDEPLI